MRKALVSIIIVAMLALAGCFSLSGGSAEPEVKILRQAKIAGKYRMYQLEVTLKPGAELPVILQLQNGEKADGYFYVEKGANTIAFEVKGTSLIYVSDMKALPNNEVASDRFSFTASQAQGLFYEMILRNIASAEQKTSATVYLEIIYPGDEPIATPLNE